MMKLSTLSQTLLAICLTSVLLVGCKKTETPTTDSKTTTTETAPAGVSDNSPTVQVMANTLKGAVAMQIVAMSGSDLSDEQKKCLNSSEAVATYLPFAKEELGKALGAESLKISDEFYTSEVGQKVVKYLEQQMQVAQGLPIEGTPIELTAEDQAKMKEFGESAAGKSIDQTNSAQNPEEMAKKIEGFATTEKTRCNIA